MVPGENESGTIVDPDLPGGLDQPAELPVELGDERPEVGALGALRVSESVEVGTVDGEEVGNFRTATVSPPDSRGGG